MPSTRRVITVTAQPEDGVLRVEVAIPLRRRRLPTASPDAQSAPRAESPGRPRVPRITRLMALAIKFQDMVDRGDVSDYADLARLGDVSRARLTQIMNLQLLAPEIQEAILFAGFGSSADEPRERDLRSVCSRVFWSEQIALCRTLSKWEGQNPLRASEGSCRKGVPSQPTLR